MRFSLALNQYQTWRKFNGLKEPTIQGSQYDLERFCLYWRDGQVEDIRDSDITDFLTLLQVLGVTSLRHYSQHLRKMFEYLRWKGYKVIRPSLIPLPRHYSDIPAYITDEEHLKLMSIALEKDWINNLRNRSILGIMHDCGLRVGELCAINIKDVNIIDGSAVIVTEKTKSQHPWRIIKWSPETNLHLIAWIRRRKELLEKYPYYNQEALFLSTLMTKAGRRLSPAAVRLFMINYCDKLKLRHIHPHEYRHRFIHKALEVHSAGVVKGMSGHAKISSLDSYTRYSDPEMAVAWDKFRA